MTGRKKILVGGVATLAILLGLVTLQHYRVKGAVERYKTRLEAEGEPLHWQEVLASPLSPDENSANLLTRLLAQLPRTGALATNPPTGMMMIQSGKATAGWAQPFVGDPELRTTNSWPEILADYESQRETLTEFRRLIAKPNIDYNLDFARGFSLLLPHLSSWKSGAQRLGAASACELRLGRTKEAVLQLRTMVALVQGTAREPILISQLVRIAIASIASAYTWDVLQARDLNDADLKALQEDWSRLEFFSPLEQTLLMERCLSLQTIQLMRESPDEFGAATSWMGGAFAGRTGPAPSAGNLMAWVEYMAKEGLDRTKAGLAEGAWRTSWSYTDELAMLKGNEALVQVVRLAIADGHAGNALRLELEMEEDGRIPEYSGASAFFGGGAGMDALRSMFSDGVAACQKSFQKALMAEANTRIVATAIALERYRLRQGAYPARLEDLVPVCVAAVPRDPVDGSPLRYERISEDVYLLYSIGLDLKDDGGDPDPPDNTAGGAGGWGRGRDWVWPQRSSGSELQAYWEKAIEKNLAEATNAMILASEWTEQYFRALANAATRTNPPSW